MLFLANSRMEASIVDVKFRDTQNNRCGRVNIVPMAIELSTLLF
jgi:hypothetical protein